jgi:hypothetical protein
LQGILSGYDDVFNQVYNKLDLWVGTLEGNMGEAFNEPYPGGRGGGFFTQNYNGDFCSVKAQPGADLEFDPPSVELEAYGWDAESEDVGQTRLVIRPGGAFLMDINGNEKRILTED